MDLHIHHLHENCSVHEPCDENEPKSCPLEHVRLRRAADKRGAWSALVVKNYLDGKPVHCGEGLYLQHTMLRSDDYGEYSVPVPTRGEHVRYEASQNGKKIDGTLYIEIGGHEFVAHLEPWMRFRWPERR